MESRRAVLEVFKLLQPRDILLACGVVCALWGKAAENEELWNCLGEDLGLNHSITDPKAAYRTAMQVYHYLVYAKNNVLYFYHCQRQGLGRSVSLSSAIEVFSNSAIVLVREGSVLVCGGLDYSIKDTTMRVKDCATRIDPKGTVQSLRPMLSCRACPAAIEVRSFLYLFGGFLTSSLSSCEKLGLWPMPTIVERLWQALPNTLFPRQACNPCTVYPFIYLCGKNLSTLERFDTLTETFALLQVNFSLGPGVRTSVIYQGDLVVIEGTHITRFCPESTHTTIQSLPGVFTQSPMNPVLQADSLFSLDQNTGLVYCLSLLALKTVPVRQLPAMCRFQH